MPLRTDNLRALAYPDLGARIDTITKLAGETFPSRTFEIQAHTREANTRSYGGPTPRHLAIETGVEMPESPTPTPVVP